VIISDVKRGQNLEAEAEAKASRPRPELRGRDQDYAIEAEAKNNSEKVPNNDNIWFKIIAGKFFLQNSRILHDFCTKKSPIT